MYVMNLEESMLCARIFAYSIGDRCVSLNQIDKDATVAMLKRLADQRWDWNEQQKQEFKGLLEFCKQMN